MHACVVVLFNFKNTRLQFLGHTFLGGCIGSVHISWAESSIVLNWCAGWLVGQPICLPGLTIWPSRKEEIELQCSLIVLSSLSWKVGQQSASDTYLYSLENFCLLDVTHSAKYRCCFCTVHCTVPYHRVLAIAICTEAHIQPICFKTLPLYSPRVHCTA